MKLKIIIIVAVAAVLLPIIFLQLFNGSGAINVAIIDNGDKKFLVIDYIDMTGYSVTMREDVVDIDSWDSEVNYKTDGLGEYRIAIKLVDAKLTDTLAEKYSANKVHVLEDVPFGNEGKYKIIIAYPPDDSLTYIIIGSDSPIYTEEQEFKEVS